VHPLRTARGFLVDHIVIHEKVASFHQLYAKLLREKAMLKVSAVKHTGCENNDGWVVAAGRREIAQIRKELRRVMVHREDRVFPKEPRKNAHQNEAVLQHVGNA